MLHYYLIETSLCGGEAVFAQMMSIESCPINTTGEFIFRDGEDYRLSWLITNHAL